MEVKENSMKENGVERTYQMCMTCLKQLHRRNYLKIQRFENFYEMRANHDTWFSFLHATLAYIFTIGKTICCNENVMVILRLCLVE